VWVWGQGNKRGKQNSDRQSPKTEIWMGFLSLFARFFFFMFLGPLEGNIPVRRTFDFWEGFAVFLFLFRFSHMLFMVSVISLYIIFRNP
jgi:hypothetical protein